VAQAGKAAATQVAVGAAAQGVVRAVVSGTGGAGTAKSTGKGIGYSSFDAFKNANGAAGKDKAWHHIVEQSQIVKSGFSSQIINNTDNLIIIDSATHAKISGYYNTKSLEFTKGLSVRDWLAGQSFEAQYNFGISVLNRFGVKL
jgi:hypothetical protein